MTVSWQNDKLENDQTSGNSLDGECIYSSWQEMEKVWREGYSKYDKAGSVFTISHFFSLASQTKQILTRSQLWLFQDF